MARRRRHRSGGEESPLEQMVEMALGSAWVGAFLTILFVIIGVGLRAQPKAIAGLAPMLGGLMLLVAAVLALVTVIGAFVRGGESILSGASAWLFGRRSGARSTPPAPPPPGTSRRVGKQVAHAPSKTRRAPSEAATPPRPPARMPESPLSKGEQAFYAPLCDVVAGQYHVMAKQSLVDVLKLRSHPQFASIAKMHVDFLLCDPQTLTPRLAIELDDRSHRDPRRAAADEYKAQLLRDGGIPLLRQQCRAAYDVQELRERIRRAATC